MAIAASVIFLFLSQLLVICELVQSHCPKEFACGNIKMWFPFSTYTRPDCGLHLVECHHGKPKIDVLPGRDWHIQRQLEYGILVTPSFDQGKDCTAFTNLTLPNSTAISFETRNVTMLKCSLRSPNETLDWNLNQYKKFSECEKGHHFDIYYNYGDDGISDVAGDHPSSCSIIRCPLGDAHTFDLQVEHQLYDVLYNVFLNWRVPESCTGCQNGKQCIVDHKNNTCSKEKSKKLGLILGIVFSAAACFCILFLVITVIRCRKKRINMDPSSKEDAGFSGIYFGASVYSYADLEEATNNFASSRKLGDGGFGIVYYGKLQDGKEVAVKVLHENNYKRMEQFMNEIRILTSLRHPNLVYLYGCTSKRSQELLLVYEYVPNGTVSDHLHGYKSNTTSLSCRRRIDIALQTATALAYLHKSDIIHRDVKTNNILLDHKFHVKVADFGLSRLFPIDVTHVSTAPQGTPGYVDPEYHECYQLTDKSDVYSFGVVLVELMSSLPAVDLSRNRHEINLANLAMRRIRSNEIDELIDPCLGYRSDPEVYRTMSSVAELAFRCLQYEKEMRPRMDEVVEVLKVISDFKDNSELKKTSKANDDMQAETKQT